VRSINAYFTSIEPNRVCYPYDPLPLPKRAEAAYSRNDKNFSATLTEINTEIVKILDQRNIRFTHILSPLQWRFDDTIKTRTVTVHILEEASRSLWVAVATAISNLTGLKGLKKVLVELVDPKRLSYKAIAYDIVPVKDRQFISNVQGRMYDALDSHMRHIWRDVGLFMCKDPNSRTSVPCLIVFVEDSLQRDWAKASTAIHETLNHRYEVRFQPSRSINLVDEQRDSNGCREDGDLPPNPRSGASISSSRKPHPQGTIRVFVNITLTGPTAPSGMLPGTTYTCTLACHHVIADANAANEEGIPPSMNYQDKPSVFYPGKLGLGNSIRSLQIEIETKECRLVQIKFNCETSSGLELPTYDWRISTSISSITAMKGRLFRCQSMRRNEPVGRVVVSSGKQASNPTGCNLMERARNATSPDSPYYHTFESCPSYHDHYLEDNAFIRLSGLSPIANMAPSEKLQTDYSNPAQFILKKSFAKDP